MSESAPPAQPAHPPLLTNFGGETVEACAARMLASCEADRPARITGREAAHIAAEGCAKSWRIVGNETLCDFYWHVAAHLARTPAEAPT